MLANNYAVRNDNTDMMAYIIGVLALIVFIYRLFMLMIPTFISAIREHNYVQAFNSLTLLV